MNYSSKTAKLFLNLYPPYVGAGVRIDYICADWTEMEVSMKLRWFNKNAVGTHFGGNLYSMIDPHYMLLLMKLLGNDYHIWDQSASIRFVKATRKRVKAHIHVSPERLLEIQHHTANGEKYLAEFRLDILDDNNEQIAEVEKVIYIKKKSN
ncbi:DUF4442 domain-containing protein [Shewanella sp. 202IG2-18]|uniref:DUF4442 domain-containing protein n=1 Tax=Parashewanella hymeniacidonis TaxID=2807618 RepID=UPI00195F31EA|nr:DUF4442 domain-containing protein [Parashewanella hymeniacidonis]MBM7071335.1 DUF4442 domain-containing protein [Parashewanella hymeniacidonis]